MKVRRRELYVTVTPDGKLKKVVGKPAGLAPPDERTSRGYLVFDRELTPEVVRADSLVDAARIAGQGRFVAHPVGENGVGQIYRVIEVRDV